MLDGVLYIEEFIADSQSLFTALKEEVEWDNRMKARKTASYGVAYNYSQIHYPNRSMLGSLESLVEQVEKQLDFCPNNCLINFYEDGQSRMGFHSDQTDILEEATGIAILSLGSERILRFRKIEDKEEKVNFLLPSGSLLYMTQEVQTIWQHAIPRMNTGFSRMSLTFRQIKH